MPVSRVVIVDDDANQRQLLTDILSAEGYDTVAVPSAQATLQQLEAAAVLIDLSLRDAPALELLAELKRRAPDTACIVVADETTQATALEAVRLGAFNYVRRPLDRQHLLVTLRRAIDFREAMLSQRQSQRNWRSLLGNLSDVVVIVAPDGRIIDANHPPAGKAAGEILGTNFVDDLIPPADRDCLRQALQRVVQTAVPERFDTVVLWPEARIPATCFLTKMNLGSGHEDVEAVALIIHDLAQGERDDQASPRNHSRYRELFEHSPIALEEEDCSRLLVYLEELRLRGVDDFETYFRRHPAELHQCASLVEVVEVNRAAVELFEAGDKKDLLGSLSRLLPPEPPESLLETVLAIAEGRTTFVSETVNKTITGRELHVIVRWTVSAGHEHDLSLILVSIVDITPRIEAERALQEKNAELETILQALPEALVYADSRRRLMKVNPAFTRVFGYQPDEVIGRNARFLYASPEEYRRQGRLRFNVESLSTPQEPYEVDYVRHDGEVFPAEVVGTRVVDSHGNIVGFLSVVQDITERKQAQDALRSSEARYRLLAEHISDVIWTLDLQGKFTYISPSVKRLRGYEVAEIMKRPWTETIAPGSLSIAKEAYERALEAIDSGQPVQAEARYLLEQPCKDGSTVWTETVATPMVDHTGRATGILGVSRDITERRLLEQQVLDAQRMEAVGQLAAGIAHDFNNLLTGINGFAELLKLEMGSDDPRQSMLNQIMASGNKAADLVSQLLAFARKQMVSPRLLYLTEELERLTPTLHQWLGPEIGLDIRPSADPWPVRMDPRQLEQLLRELSLNARQSMGSQGELTVGAHNVRLADQDETEPTRMPSGDYVVITFHDNGPALSSETKRHLFEPFFVTSRQVADGTGLRLAAAYGIVKQNAGYIWVESELRRGNTYRIYLPRAQTD